VQLAGLDHFADSVGEDGFEAAVGAEAELVLEELGQLQHAIAHDLQIGRRSRRVQHRQGDQATLDEELDDVVLGSVELDPLALRYAVEDAIAGAAVTALDWQRGLVGCVGLEQLAVGEHLGRFVDRFGPKDAVPGGTRGDACAHAVQHADEFLAAQ